MRHIHNVVESIGALLLATIVTIVLIQVVGRYVLRISLSWPEELARYVLVWLLFFGAAAAASRHQQIVVDTLTELAPAGVRRVMQVIATLAGLLAVGILIWTSQPLFGPASRSTSPATGLASFWIFVALPIGGALLAVFTLADLVRMLRGKPLEEAEAEELTIAATEDVRG